MGGSDPRTISVFGVRGALPTTDAAYSEFGGNTSCIAVDCGEDLVVLDAGTGIIPLGAALIGTARYRRIHILLSHLHLDHIEGLMGFSPLFEPDADVHIYGEGHQGASLRDALCRILGPPYWPVSLDDAPCRPVLHEIGPGLSFQLADGLNVRTSRGCHPNGSLLFRVGNGPSSVVYTLDCELTKGLFPRLADFARDCGLLVWDANFVQADLVRGWGHSTWQQGIDVARAAGAKRVLMSHFDRSYTDDFLREQERLAMQMDDKCLFAREGMVIDL